MRHSDDDGIDRSSRAGRIVVCCGLVVVLLVLASCGSGAQEVFHDRLPATTAPEPALSIEDFAALMRAGNHSDYDFFESPYALAQRADVVLLGSIKSAKDGRQIFASMDEKAPSLSMIELTVEVEKAVGGSNPQLMAKDFVVELTDPSAQRSRSILSAVPVGTRVLLFWVTTPRPHLLQLPGVASKAGCT